MDGAGRQTLGEILARQDLGLGRQAGGGELGGVAFGHVTRRQQSLELALGIGKGGQHGMAAIKPHRLVTAAWRPVGAVGTGAHGEALYGETAVPANPGAGDLGLDATH